MTAARKLSEFRIFRTNDLFQIRGTWSHLEGVGALPRSVRPWVFWFVSLIKCNCGEIHAPIWAITKAAFESCARTTCSDSSTRRALRWLVDAGYIKKRTFRVGRDAHGVVITINKSKFDFFLKPRHDKKISHTHLHRSNCEGDNLPNNNKCLHTSNSVIDSKCIKSKNSAKQKPKPESTHRYHPIVHTLWCVLGGPEISSGSKPNNSEIWAALSRARACLENNAESVLDWSYWKDRWPTMSHSEREYAARNDILPHIYDKPQRTSEVGVTELVEALSKQSEPSRPSGPPPYTYNPSLSREDNAIIEQAQKNLWWKKRNMENTQYAR